MPGNARQFLSLSFRITSVPTFTEQLRIGLRAWDFPGE